ncbi:MAG: branched-chain amino acid ABC transporter permease [Sphaerochaetaceae bacterium]|nr:branched-chain amino acid ABC transporter permease [Sphaerochaetaceae bacterium]
MSFAEFFQHFINGVTLGGTYALIALGYTMVYGILGFINFAHGDILMVGAYIGLFTFNALRGSQDFGLWPTVAFFIAMVVSMVFCACLGMLTERIAYKPLRKATRLAPLLSAIGVSFILSNTAAWLWGTQSRRFPKPFEDQAISFGGVSVTPHQILILVVTVIMMVAMQLYVTKTRMGKAMRATSLDQDTARLMGINSDHVISLTFAIGSALAACGGILIALDFTCYPTMGTMTGTKAFVAAVIGGIGNIPGAMLGGVILGLLETFGVAILGIPTGMRDTIAFVALIIILLVKPEGILGKAEKEKV